MSLLKPCTDVPDSQKTVKSALKNRIIMLSYENTNEECLLLEVFLKETLMSLQSDVISFLKTNIAMKFNIELHAIYIKPFMKVFENSSLQPKIFKTEMQESFDAKDFQQQYLTQVKSLKRRTEEFQAKEGGWTMLQLVKAVISLCKYQPLRGASFLPLPKNLKLKQACVNVQNKKDNFCFKWAIIAALSSGIKHLYRPSSYNVDIDTKIIKLREFCLNFEGLKFPLQIIDVSIFEHNNPNISLNVFGYDEKNDLIIGPYYKTKKKKTHHINLLYFEGKILNKTVGHYVWIKNFSRLIRSQMTACRRKIVICDVCLQYFSEDQYLEKHVENCGKKVQDVLLREKCALEFKNSIKMAEVPFVIYASLKKFPNYLTTDNPLSYVFIYFVKCSYNDDLSKWCIFKGKNAPREFADSLIKDAKYYHKNYSNVIMPKLPLTSEENLEYEKNNSCWLCLKQVIEDKVKFYCRLSGKYRGPVHHGCALNYKVPKKFPVIFSNLSKDDCLLIIKQLCDIDDDPINARPLNNESSISFEKDIKIEIGKLELRFLNFSRFLSCGVTSLVKNMSHTDFKSLKLTFSEDNKFKLDFTKMLIPSEYLNSVEQLEEKCLPKIDNFYDSVLEEKCSTECYEHAQNVWSNFECKTLGDYLTICLKVEVLLLCDVFENFRLVCRKTYNLDPCHYYSAAEFSWDSMLKITDTKLNLQTDKKMNAFLEKGMRVGISKCFQRSSVANNKYLCDYNDQLPTKYLMCFHANDLYGRVMTDYLPQGNFEWETDLNISLNSIPEDSEIGYILEVDLEYPSNTFDTHKRFPFCCENANSLDTNEKKLVVISNKFNYIIYYKNLQQCLTNGLKLKKIHRILKFKQSDWLKNYIMLNKTPKNNNNNPFTVKVLKLMNTALYEKIMEKSEKKIKIMKKWENDGRKLEARTFIVKPEFSSVSVFDENLVAIEYNTNVFKHVPVYLEFIISELVKSKLYSFHYDYIMPKYKTNVELNYVDTDSLIYTITTDDLYSDIKNDIYTMINTKDSDHSRLLLKTVGIMKDANDGVVLKEFIGFRSKLYALITETMPETKDNLILKYNNIFNNAKLCGYTNLSYNHDIFCDSIESFKLKLYQRYALLLEKELPLSFLDDRSNILSNEIMNKLV